MSFPPYNPKIYELILRNQIDLSLSLSVNFLNDLFEDFAKKELFIQKQIDFSLFLLRKSLYSTALKLLFGIQNQLIPLLNNLESQKLLLIQISNYIGLANLKIKRKKNAIFSFDQALKLLYGSESNYLFCITFINLSAFFDLINKYEKSMEYSKNSIIFIQKNIIENKNIDKSQFLYAFCMRNLALSQMKLGFYEFAYENIHKSNEILNKNLEKKNIFSKIFDFEIPDLNNKIKKYKIKSNILDFLDFSIIEKQKNKEKNFHKKIIELEIQNLTKKEILNSPEKSENENESDDIIEKKPEKIEKPKKKKKIKDKIDTNFDKLEEINKKHKFLEDLNNLKKPFPMKKKRINVLNLSDNKGVLCEKSAQTLKNIYFKEENIKHLNSNDKKIIFIENVSEKEEKTIQKIIFDKKFEEKIRFIQNKIRINFERKKFLIKKKKKLRDFQLFSPFFKKIDKNYYKILLKYKYDILELELSLFNIETKIIEKIIKETINVENITRDIVISILDKNTLKIPEKIEVKEDKIDKDLKKPEEIFEEIEEIKILKISKKNVLYLQKSIKSYLSKKSSNVKIMPKIKIKKKIISKNFDYYFLFTLYEKSDKLYIKTHLYENSNIKILNSIEIFPEIQNFFSIDSLKTEIWDLITYNEKLKTIEFTDETLYKFNKINEIKIKPIKYDKKSIIFIQCHIRKYICRLKYRERLNSNKFFSFEIFRKIIISNIISHSDKLILRFFLSKTDEKIITINIYVMKSKKKPHFSIIRKFPIEISLGDLKFICLNMFRSIKINKDSRSNISQINCESSEKLIKNFISRKNSNGSENNEFENILIEKILFQKVFALHMINNLNFAKNNQIYSKFNNFLNKNNEQYAYLIQKQWKIYQIRLRFSINLKNSQLLTKNSSKNIFIKSKTTEITKIKKEKPLFPFIFEKIFENNEKIPIKVLYNSDFQTIVLEKTKSEILAIPISSLGITNFDLKPEFKSFLEQKISLGISLNNGKICFRPKLDIFHKNSLKNKKIEKNNENFLKNTFNKINKKKNSIIKIPKKLQKIIFIQKMWKKKISANFFKIYKTAKKYGNFTIFRTFIKENNFYLQITVGFIEKFKEIRIFIKEIDIKINEKPVFWRIYCSEIEKIFPDKLNNSLEKKIYLRNLSEIVKNYIFYNVFNLKILDINTEYKIISLISKNSEINIFPNFIQKNIEKISEQIKNTDNLIEKKPKNLKINAIIKIQNYFKSRNLQKKFLEKMILYRIFTKKKKFIRNYCKKEQNSYIILIFFYDIIKKQIKITLKNLSNHTGLNLCYTVNLEKNFDLKNLFSYTGFILENLYYSKTYEYITLECHSKLIDFQENSLKTRESSISIKTRQFFSLIKSIISIQRKFRKIKTLEKAKLLSENKHNTILIQQKYGQLLKKSRIKLLNNYYNVFIYKKNDINYFTLLENVIKTEKNYSENFCFDNTQIINLNGHLIEDYIIENLLIENEVLKLKERPKRLYISQKSIKNQNFIDLLEKKDSILLHQKQNDKILFNVYYNGVSSKDQYNNLIEVEVFLNDLKLYNPNLKMETPENLRNLANELSNSFQFDENTGKPYIDCSKINPNCVKILKNSEKNNKNEYSTQENYLKNTDNKTSIHKTTKYYNNKIYLLQINSIERKIDKIQLKNNDEQNDVFEDFELIFEITANFLGSESNSKKTIEIPFGDSLILLNLKAEYSEIKKIGKNIENRISFMENRFIFELKNGISENLETVIRSILKRNKNCEICFFYEKTVQNLYLGFKNRFFRKKYKFFKEYCAKNEKIIGKYIKNNEFFIILKEINHLEFEISAFELKNFNRIYALVKKKEFLNFLESKHFKLIFFEKIQKFINIQNNFNKNKGFIESELIFDEINCLKNLKKTEMKMKKKLIKF